MFPEVLAGERLLQGRTISGVATMAHSGNRRIVICIRNDDHMIDESGEDYPYPKEYLIPVRLPKTVDQVLVSAA